MSLRQRNNIGAAGTRRESYEIGKEDLEELRDLGMDVKTPYVPVKSINVLYTENGGHPSVSLTAERYFLGDLKLFTASGKDFGNWGEVRRTLQQLDRH